MINAKDDFSPEVFVSRSLSPTSPLLSYLEERSINYEARSLIQFEKVAFEFPATGWLFFYSKTAVDMFLSSECSNLGAYNYAFFGKATARHFKELTTIEPDFIGNANAQNVSGKLRAVLNSKSITFMVGRNSLRSVQTDENAVKQWTELIIYDHSPKQKETLDHYTYAIITSPMNAAAFIDNHGTADQYVAIGQTTQSALKRLIEKEDIHRAETPSEEGIVKTLSELISGR